ncbi:hypothetical protein RSAG8_06632, partial [Rhizoctonia solani AG-8 WAC10335]
MADKHKDKRQKVVPPTAPKTHASRSSSVKPGNYARSRSMSDVAREQTPLSGKSALATRAYPTPELTARKSVPRADSSELSSNRLPPLDLGVVSTPRSASRGITHPGLSDSDDARIGKQAPPKIKRKKSVLPSDSDDSDDSEGGEGHVEGAVKIWLGLGGWGDQDPDEGQGSERDEDQGSEGSDEEGDQSSEEVDEDIYTGIHHP